MACCFICGATFASAKSLNKHLKHVHDKAYSRANHLKIHLKVHNEVAVKDKAICNCQFFY